MRNDLTGDFGLLYGGIDSDGIIKRARNMTSVMAGVAKRHAVRTSCPVVLRELFLLPDEDRRLFGGIDKNVTPVSEFSDTFEITAASRSEMETLSLQGHLAAGEKTVKIAFLNDYWHETKGDRNVLLDRLTVRQGNTVVYHYEMENLNHRPQCHHMEQDAFHLSGSGTGCVLAVPVDIPSDGTYQIDIAAWATHADGGWDVTSFCDPKVNTPGEPIINHWAEHDETRQVGNLSYAPFAKNQEFFEKYHRMMLVINGVDAQTNAHTVGIVHNWSGRNSEGYPTLGALAAAHFAPALPVGYLSFGGFSNTSGLTRFTRLDDPRLLREIAPPRADMGRFFSDADWEAMGRHRAETVARLASAPGLLPGDEAHLEFYRTAFATEGLKAYADAIPPEDELEDAEEGGDDIGSSTLRRQAQLTVLAFKTQPGLHRLPRCSGPRRGSLPGLWRRWTL